MKISLSLPSQHSMPLTIQQAINHSKCLRQNIIEKLSKIAKEFEYDYLNALPLASMEVASME